MEGPLNLFHDAHAASNWETACTLAGYGQRRSHRCEWDVDSLERGRDCSLDKPISKCQQNVLDDPIGKPPDPELGHSPHFCNFDHNDDFSNGFKAGEASNLARKNQMRGNDSAFLLREPFPSNDSTCLTLKLAGNADIMMEEGNGSNNGKGSQASPSGAQSLLCQVDDCQADLSSAKDYHRRHKVCEMHAKAVKAPVGGLMQRFCQQCSRFHLLQEFDEGKRSCRWRLAGHNKRRRKSQSDSLTLPAYSLSEEDRDSTRAAGILGLIDFLRQQTKESSSSSTEMVMNKARRLLQFLSKGNSVSEEQNDASMISEKSKDFNLGQSHANLKSLAGAVGDTQLLAKLAGICPEVQLLLLDSTKNQKMPDQRSEPKLPISHISHAFSSGAVVGQCMQGCTLSLLPSVMPDKQSTMPDSSRVSLNTSVSSLHTFPIISGNLAERSVPATNELPQKSAEDRNLACSNVSKISTLIQNSNVNNNGHLEHNASPVHEVGSCHPRPIIDLQKLPSEQMSEMLESNFDQSPASSEEDWQDSTGRIWFKLIDRSPSEIPQAIRAQILEWLSYYPTNIESYLRPGCVILTIFVSMLVRAWTELIKDLQLSLNRLIQTGNDAFWRKGRIIVQIGCANAFIIDGEVHVNKPFIPGSLPQLVAIHPLAVIAGQETELLLKGYNLCTPGTSIVCAYHEKYEVQEVLSSKQLSEFPPKFDQHMECMQEVSFNFKVASNNIGRCFVQVEQYAVTGNFIPIIVADKDICAEICTLENEIHKYTLHASRQQHDAGMEARNFLNELGWLFQWNFLEISCSMPEIVSATHFSPCRFKWLLIYAVERNWCAVLKKLLDIFFISELGSRESIVEVGLLHRAVQCKCRLIVDMLLAYDTPLNDQSRMEIPDAGNTTKYKSLQRRLIFRPDMSGPAAGLTPLHLAATMQDADDIVNSLTNDPAQVGLHAWSNACDSTGQTPLAYALERGHQSYIRLVDEKLGRMDALRSSIINFDDSYLSMESQIVLPLTTMLIESDRKNAPQFDLESCRMKSPARVTCPPCRMSTEVRAMPSQSCRDCHGPTFIMASNRISGLRGSAFRPFVLSMIGVATLCVCVCLVFKSAPRILFVTVPFTWKSVRWGYL